MSKNYFPLPPLIEKEKIERASHFSTAELCDGMKDLNISRDGAMDSALMPIDGNLYMVGTACTVETSDGDNFPIHIALYQSKPEYVLLIDGKNYTERPYMGDLMGATAKAVGLNGIVVDGLVRDRMGLKEMQLPVYARGFMQRGPSKQGPGKINVPIMCAGVIVHPGDLVVGDYDGVTVVPREHIDAVLAAAEKKKTYEENRRVVIAEYAKCRKEGTKLPELAPDWVLKMLDQ
ncbi:MAG: hypothetical protein WBI82_02685 [Sphaerochaeta sp.]